MRFQPWLWPNQIYNYLYGTYGTVGLMFGGIFCVMLVICIFIALDRRK
jgi:hypothetical protein